MVTDILGQPHDIIGFALNPPAEPFPVMDNLILKEGTYGMLYGTASSAKSLVAQAMAIALAGDKAFGGELNTHEGPYKVMFLDLDQGADTTLRRWCKLIQPWYQFGPKIEVLEEVFQNIFHYTPPSVFSLFGIREQLLLIKQLVDNKIDILMIDCLARSLGGLDENLNSTADEYFKAVRKIQEEVQKELSVPLTVIVIHHQRKSAVMPNGKVPDFEEMRGASGWRDSLDFQLQLKKINDVVTIYRRKERNSGDPDRKWTFRLVDCFNGNDEAVGIKFVYEPDASLKPMAEVVWDSLKALTDSQEGKAVKLHALEIFMKEHQIKGRPWIRNHLIDVMAHLYGEGKVKCSVPDPRAQNSHKRFWTVV